MEANKTTGLPNPHKGLRTLFLNELQEINHAEKLVIQILPGMIGYVANYTLTNALEKHLLLTTDVLIRLKAVFFLIGESESETDCPAIMAVASSSLQIIRELDKGNVRDAAIILAVLKIDHFEIASYATLCSFAKTLDKHDICSLLLKISEEKKAANDGLTRIIESIELKMIDIYNE